MFLPDKALKVLLYGMSLIHHPAVLFINNIITEGNNNIQRAKHEYKTLRQR